MMTAWPVNISANDIEVHIGLRAHRGVEKAVKRWQATATRLSRDIPGYHFKLIPFTINSELDQAVTRNEFSFILTNPSSTVEHQLQRGLRPLLTLVNKRHGKGYTRFGSVIFTRADRADLNRLTDLKGKIFMAVDKRGFGGWRVAWQEILKNGVDPLSDFREMRFAGGLQDKVVYSVRDGLVDAGSVRTDMLERMAARGEIDLSSFKVLGLKQHNHFPFFVSTALFPEWAFSKTRNTGDDLAKKVKQVLLSIQAEDQAAKNGKYLGWVDALNYTPVKKLLEELKLGPFHVSRFNLLPSFLSQYWRYVAAGVTALLLVMFLAVYLFSINRRMNRMQLQISADSEGRKKVENILIELASQSVDRTRGIEFFRECVQGLARLYEMKLIFIILIDEFESGSLRTYLAFEDGHFVKNRDINIEESLCYGLLKNEFELISSGVRSQYPGNKLLESINANSFFGSVLKSSSGKVLGVIAMLDDRELNIPEWQKPVLRIFANRIGLELQRIRDEDEMRGLTDKITWHSGHDPMTRLVNRHNFEIYLSEAISRLEYTKKIHLLFHLGLDNFSLVNQTCGHLAGNELLKQLSNQLKTIMGDKDVICRMGGDEFGILALDYDERQVVQLAEKVLDFTRVYHYRWKNNDFDITASIGVVVLADARMSVNSALNCVDTARYVAKDNGGDQYCIYEEKSHQAHLRKSEAQWVEDLKYALKEENFTLYQQRIRPLQAHEASKNHVEILLRMKSRSGDLLLPGNFIEAAVRHKLMPVIDRWVIENVFRFIQASNNKGSSGCLYSINLSAQTLKDVGFLEFLEKNLQQYNVSANDICFEIAEASAINYYSVSVDFIRHLRRIGFRIALDNFGSGLLSYVYIKNMPLDYIKLDGAFVRGIDQDSLNKAIVDATAKIGRDMGIKTIAVWVENEIILNQLMSSGVDFVQGYAIGEPEPLPG